MSDFVSVTREGRFSLNGKRWFCNSAIYFGRFPGAMQNWISNDDIWEKNRVRLEPDFSRMQALGLNHTAIFLKNEMIHEAGKSIAKGFDRLDHVVEVAKRHDIRVTLFIGGFVDTPEEFHRITGETWHDENRWLPSFNERLFQAYVQQVAPLVRHYQSEPYVLGHGDRIDRFFKGFDNVTIPFDLKAHWAEMLKARYGSFKNLLEVVGGSLEGDPKDFDQVLLPQESKFSGSLRNPLAYDYILWQKKVIGDTQARWDAEMMKISPRQVFWTPFEGPTLDWSMLDGFTPETHRLHAIWMEYYHFQAVRATAIGPFEEWAHTREIVTHRMHHESPTIYNTAYLFTRYVKLSTRRPVVICHGTRLDFAPTGIETEAQQAAIFDRTNAACLNADADGWHYWQWQDDWQSSLAHRAEQKAHPEKMYWQGETMGIYDYDDHPRQVAAVVSEYSRELLRRTRAGKPFRQNESLVLSSAAPMYTLYRRLAVQTAAAVNGAMQRLGVQADYLWTAQNDVRISQEVLNSYKLIVVADNMFSRDFRDTPEKLLKYVGAGGTLYLALHQFDQFQDEHGVVHESPALRKLSGVDPKGSRNWPGAEDQCANWPFPTEIPKEANFDAPNWPRLHWGICPEFRHRAAIQQRQEMLGFVSADDDRFAVITGLVAGAETIAVGKFAFGNTPFVYRHKIGRGTVYVNAWTNNVFRDCSTRHDYGGWDYDWILSLPIESSGLEDVDITRGASVWLRNQWGYFWRDL